MFPAGSDDPARLGAKRRKEGLNRRKEGKASDTDRFFGPGLFARGKLKQAAARAGPGQFGVWEGLTTAGCRRLE